MSFFFSKDFDDWCKKHNSENDDELIHSQEFFLSINYMCPKKLIFDFLINGMNISNYKDDYCIVLAHILDKKELHLSGKQIEFSDNEIMLIKNSLSNYLFDNKNFEIISKMDLDFVLGVLYKLGFEKEINNLLMKIITKIMLIPTLNKFIRIRSDYIYKNGYKNYINIYVFSNYFIEVLQSKLSNIEEILNKVNLYTEENISLLFFYLQNKKVEFDDEYGYTIKALTSNFPDKIISL